MKKKTIKSKMTIDKLANMTQNEFCAVREEMQEGFTAIRKEMHGMKEEMHEGFASVKEEIVKEISQTVMDSNDKLATKIDSFLKNSSAHDSLHYGITDQLLDHETRLKKVETKLAK